MGVKPVPGGVVNLAKQTILKYFSLYSSCLALHDIIRTAMQTSYDMLSSNALHVQEGRRRLVMG